MPVKITAETVIPLIPPSFSEISKAIGVVVEQVIILLKRQHFRDF